MERGTEEIVVSEAQMRDEIAHITAEIERAHERMQKDEAEIERLRERTHRKLVEVRALLAR